MSLLLALNDDVLDLITAKLSATSINTSKAVNKRFKTRGRRVLQTHANFAARRAAYRLEGHMGDMLKLIQITNPCSSCPSNGCTARATNASNWTRTLAEKEG